MMPTRPSTSPLKKGTGNCFNPSLYNLTLPLAARMLRLRRTLVFVITRLSSAMFLESSDPRDSCLLSLVMMRRFVPWPSYPPTPSSLLSLALGPLFAPLYRSRRWRMSSLVSWDASLLRLLPFPSQ